MSGPATFAITTWLPSTCHGLPAATDVAIVCSTQASCAGPSNSRSGRARSASIGAYSAGVIASPFDTTWWLRASNRVSTITSVARSPKSKLRLIAAQGWPGLGSRIGIHSK